MTLKDDIAKFQRNLNRCLETTEYFYRLCNEIQDCPEDELSYLFRQLQNLCEELEGQLSHTGDCLMDINRQWGNATIQHYHSRTVNITNIPGNTSSVNSNSLPVSPGSEIDFLSTDPSLFPIVKLLAFISNDASVVYSQDSELRLSDLKNNPTSYEKPPLKKVLGDLGELAVLDMLLEPTGEDRLNEQEMDQIQVKPNLASRITDNPQNPDFYVPSRNLVIDSKAWKKSNNSNLRAVINKYVNLEVLNQGGEVRLYFPSDTYQQYQTLLEKLTTPIGSVRIRAVPMTPTYKDLTWKLDIMMIFLKSRLK